MRPFGKTITLDEARAIVEQAVHPLDRTEVVRLEQANGRVLARDVFSNADVPPFSRAAMDGYAVRAEETIGASPATPRTLQRIETIFTGQVPQRRLGAGECAEIATGAPMPEGADAVVMVEETDIDERGVVSIFARVSRARTSAGKAPISRRASTCCSRACCSTRAGSDRSQRSA